MQLKLRTKDTFAKLTIESGSVKVTEELAIYNGHGNKWIVSESQIEEFITIANDLSRFNKVSDVDFCLNIVSAFLNDGEREEFMERMAQPNLKQ